MYLEDCSYCRGSSFPGDVNTGLYSVIAFLSLNGPFTLDIYGSVLNGTQSPFGRVTALRACVCVSDQVCAGCISGNVLKEQKTTEHLVVVIC